MKPSRPLEPHPRAIVIGASTGIGAALTRELTRRGYVVAAVARQGELLEQLCRNINATTPDGICAKPYVHDVTDFTAVPHLFRTIVQDLGGLDMVIYNAGVMPSVGADEFDFAKDRQQIEVNLLGAMAWLNEAAERFRLAGGGHIVGISSVAGDRGRRYNPAYHTSKGGLSVYLESLRNRLSQHGVHVTTIKPGMVETQMLENAPQKLWVISATEAAERIVAAAESGRQTVYIPARWRWVMLIIRHIPSFIFRRLNL